MNDSKTLRTMFLWALLPIICFVIIIPAIKWYADNIYESPVPQDDKISWDEIWMDSPDVVIKDVDSIPYFGSKVKASLKKDTLMAADVTHLFPEANVRKLTFIASQDLWISYFNIWNHNGTCYNAGRMRRMPNGDFYVHLTLEGERMINLGKTTARLNHTPAFGMNMNLSLTILNVTSIVSLLFVLIGFGLLYDSNHKKVPSWQFCILGAVLCSTAVHVLGFFIDWKVFSGNLAWYPERIAILWLYSEIGLLIGVNASLKPGEDSKQKE